MIPSPTVEALLLQSAVELAAAIRTRTVTSRRGRRRPRAPGSARQPFAQRDGARALLRSPRRGRARRRPPPRATDAGELPPFHGVPCSIKESFGARTDALVGRPRRAARRRRDGRRNPPSHGCARRASFRSASPTPPSCACGWRATTASTAAPLQPTIPVAPPAGARAERGALVGAGALLPWALGPTSAGRFACLRSSTGCSVTSRRRGSCPTSGSFPTPKVTRSSSSARARWCDARRDLMPVLRVLAGPHADDRVARAMHLGDPADIDLRDVTVIDVRERGSLGMFPVDARLLDAQEAAASALSKRGAKVRSARLPVLREDHRAPGARRSTRRRRHALRHPARQRNPHSDCATCCLREIPRAARGRSQYTLPSLMLCAVGARREGGVPVDQVPGARAQPSPARGALRDARPARRAAVSVAHARGAEAQHAPLLAPPVGLHRHLQHDARAGDAGSSWGSRRTGCRWACRWWGRPECDAVTIRSGRGARKDTMGGWVPPRQWS